MLTTLCLFASALVLVSWAAKRRWFGFVVAAVLLALIAYLLFFYTGTVARSVLRPGPPSGAEAAGFYFGIQQLQAALLDTYMAVVYLSGLSLVTCFKSAHSPGIKPQG